MIITVPTQSTREVITLTRCDDPGIISAKVRKPRGGLFRLTLAGGVKTWAYGDEIIVRNEVAA
ncbi:hypothetical protein [Rhodococcoides fascians]|uniref:hypothetical protein n=1 Tax=Rhodococcoides fascians TaxID=1828 RepID=UPI00050C55F6|nr:hypothetical protein [Rhodococcus fascians]